MPACAVLPTSEACRLLCSNHQGNGARGVYLLLFSGAKREHLYCEGALRVGTLREYHYCVGAIRRHHNPVADATDLLEGTNTVRGTKAAPIPWVGSKEILLLCEGH